MPIDPIVELESLAEAANDGVDPGALAEAALEAAAELRYGTKEERPASPDQALLIGNLVGLLLRDLPNTSAEALMIGEDYSDTFLVTRPSGTYRVRVTEEGA